LKPKKKPEEIVQENPPQNEQQTKENIIVEVPPQSQTNTVV